MISRFSQRRNVVFGRTSNSNKMTQDFSVRKMIIFPTVPLPSFALSDPKDMHVQLQTRDKRARLEKKQETSLDTYTADDVKDAPEITCVKRYLSLEAPVSRDFKASVTSRR
jgi:hypothetical protein